MMNSDKKLTVFLVDDDDIEAESVERMLQKVRMDAHFIRATDGVQALEMLRGENGHQKLQEPLLTLLDLNMPKMNGIEFLDELRNDSELCSSIVFMLTTSSSEEDIARAYSHKIAGFIVKTASQDEYALKINTLIGSYRLGVEFPIPATRDSPGAG